MCLSLERTEGVQSLKPHKQSLKGIVGWSDQRPPWYRINHVLKWKMSQFPYSVCAYEKTQTSFVIVLYLKKQEKFDPYGSLVNI